MNNSAVASRPRYLYVKNGDVVEQAQRIHNAGDSPATSGPDAFLTDFIRSDEVGEVLLVSRFNRSGRYTADGVDSRVFADGKSGLAKLVVRPWRSLQLFAMALLFRPDRILCGTAGSRFWLCGVLAKLLGVPLVHSRHNRVTTGSDPWFHRLSANIDSFVLRRCVGVACHGPYLVEEVAQAGVALNRIVEFDVDFDDFLVEMKELDSARDQTALDVGRRLLFVGRLERNKGVFDLLTAMQPAFARDAKLKLVIAGHGSAQSAFEARVEQLDLTDRVELLGVVDHREVVRHMLGSYAVVTPTQPSFPEGRCMVVLESLVTGTPAIVPDFGPFPFAITDGINGLCYPAGSVPGLQNAIDRILDDDSLYAELKRGASAEGIRLQKPPARFMEAIEQAFAAEKSGDAVDVDENSTSPKTLSENNNGR